MQRLITASATSNGQPLYRGPEGWTPKLAEAHPFAEPEQAQRALERAREEEALVCDPYLIEVQVDAIGFVPTTLKERIRAQGPTVAYA